MRESRTYGSVRGALSNGRSYRDLNYFFEKYAPWIRQFVLIIFRVYVAKFLQYIEDFFNSEQPCVYKS